MTRTLHRSKVDFEEIAVATAESLLSDWVDLLRAPDVWDRTRGRDQIRSRAHLELAGDRRG